MHTYLFLLQCVALVIAMKLCSVFQSGNVFSQAKAFAAATGMFRVIILQFFEICD